MMTRYYHRRRLLQSRQDHRRDHEDHHDKEPDPKNDGDTAKSVPTPSEPKPGLDQSMLDALKPTPEEGNITPVKRIQNFFKGLTEGKSPFLCLNHR